MILITKNIMLVCSILLKWSVFDIETIGVHINIAIKPMIKFFRPSPLETFFLKQEPTDEAEKQNTKKITK